MEIIEGWDWFDMTVEQLRAELEKYSDNEIAVMQINSLIDIKKNGNPMEKMFPFDVGRGND